MHKTFIFCSVLFLCIMKSYANDSIFNKTFLKVATELTHSDPERAIHISDSLFVHSTTKLQKLSALMLTANVYYRKADLKQSFDYAQRAEAIAIEIKDYDWQIRIHGFYSTIYRDIRFINEGLKHLDYVDKLLPKLKDKGKRNVIDILNLQAKAYFHSLNSDYDAVLQELNEGLALYSDLEESTVGPYHIANSEEFRGRMYLIKNDYERSAEAYQNAINSLQKIDLTDSYPVYGYVYSGIGALRLQQNLNDEAKEYFNKAKKVVEINKSDNLRVFYKKHLRTYYAQVEDWENYAITTDAIAALEKKIEKQIDLLLLNLFGEIREESDANIFKAKVYKNIAFVVVGVLLLLILMLNTRKKRHKRQVQSILEKIDSLKTAESTPDSKTVLEKEDSKNSGLNISEDTLHRIKQRLKDFEQEELFLDPSVSTVSIATYCETNVRYISEIINTHNNESVSAYINRLRVTYILKKLRDEKIYRTYKISHLADEAGFSNHSKFSAEFKRVTGIAPSSFISRMS